MSHLIAIVALIFGMVWALNGLLTTNDERLYLDLKYECAFEIRSEQLNKPYVKNFWFTVYAVNDKIREENPDLNHQQIMDLFEGEYFESIFYGFLSKCINTKQKEE